MGYESVIKKNLPTQVKGIVLIGNTSGGIQYLANDL